MNLCGLLLSSAKEIRLKHAAPVVSLVVIDSDAYPLPDPIDVQNERAKPPNMSGHNLIVCSEEQFKVSTCLKKKKQKKDGSVDLRVYYVSLPVV